MILKSLKAGYSHVVQALKKTGSLLSAPLTALFKNKVDPQALEKLEQLFYEADFGVELASELTQKVKLHYQENPEITPEEAINYIQGLLISELSTVSSKIELMPQGPTIIAIIGVNGNGKTTSIAKIGKYFREQGQNVLLAAADTYRAAAIDQLEIWADRLSLQIVKGAPKSDPSAVAFDAVTAAKSRDINVLLIDTAGRLHTKVPLMQELEKMRRTIKKVIPEAPHETLLVIDANNGQNGIDQARTFNKFMPLTGLIITKLDGRAKGGIIFQIHRQLGIPVKFLGVGEGADDLQPFDSQAFCEAIFA